MEVKIQKASTEYTLEDKIAIALYFSHNLEDRPLDGVFAYPYNDDGNLKIREGVEYFFDSVEEIDGRPHFKSYGWRWWGYKSKPLIEELSKLGVSIVEAVKPNNEEVETYDKEGNITDE
jgi:hypothetical protein